MIRLKLLPPLTRLVGEKEIAVDVGRASLKVVIEQAMAQNGKFRTALLDSEGRLSHEYSCLFGDRAWNASSLDDVEVRDGDEIVIMLPIAGGA
jgi:molybdopterin converting factor small subunit